MDDLPKKEFTSVYESLARIQEAMRPVGDMLARLSEKFQQSLEIDAQIRGKILIYTIAVERSIGELLATYFCRDDETKKLFQETVLRNLNFRKKIEILHRIIKVRHPELLKEYSKLNTRLVDILERRNKLAHSEPSSSLFDHMANVQNEQLTLESIEKGQDQPYTITKKEAEEYVEEMSSIMTALSDLSKSLSSPKPSTP